MTEGDPAGSMEAVVPSKSRRDRGTRIGAPLLINMREDSLLPRLDEVLGVDTPNGKSRAVRAAPSPLSSPPTLVKRPK